MSFGSTDGTNRLASPWWRIRHSAWLLAVIAGIGMLSFVGFVYVGLRVRNRKFWIAFIVGCVSSASMWFLMADTDPATVGSQGNDALTNVAIVVWLGQIVYAFVLNRDYLRWRATRSVADEWYNQTSGLQQTASLAAAPIQPAVYTPVATAGSRHSTVGMESLTVSPSEFYATPQPPATPGAPAVPASTAPAHGLPTARPPLNINTADADELVAGLNLDPILAGMIVGARQVRGGFDSLNDLAEATAMRPHELVKLRGTVVFGPKLSRPSGAQGQIRASGRILDV